MKVIKLYNYWRSSSSWRVRIALAHKGIDYEYVPIHLVEEGGKQHTEWFRSMNPMSQVPVLEVEDDDGDTRDLGQSMAILEFLEENFPEPPMLPAEPFARSQARQLAEIVNSGIQPLQNLAVIQRLRAMDEDVKEWCQHWIRQGLQAYETLLAMTAGTYSVGDNPTWADACLIPQLYNARRFHLDLSPFPAILEVEENCNALDAFQASHPENQPDAVVQ